MNFKTIILLILVVLITIFFMHNTAPVEFWFFGSHHISLSWIIAITLFIGIITGGILLRPRKRKTEVIQINEEASSEMDGFSNSKSSLSDEDRDYIS
ncbi:LapA family protein [Sphingobacterium sp. SRCM116780]|uniref:LapA family protein n=1 Tax=Sphingobacterium sp. SRCM116780 TaxID=2907623 RepID=UPI001F29C026|nr:LapA family protein [Sphingobacterium sp. SRCM116780]UIR57550.1 LapA family protein [Sphingobacterium sp. SRCM116780]